MAKIKKEKNGNPKNNNAWVLTSDEFGIHLGTHEIKHVERPKSIISGEKFKWDDIRVFLKGLESNFMGAQSKLRDIHAGAVYALGKGPFKVYVHMYDPTGMFVETWDLKVNDVDFYYGHQSSIYGEYVEYPFLRLKLSSVRVLEGNDEGERDDNEEVVNVPIEQHRKEMIERKENENGIFSSNNNEDARVIDENELKEKRPDLYNWLVDHWGDGVSDYCVFIHKSLDEENDLVRVKLYTNEYMYSIKTMLGRVKDYMDCVVQNRKCEAGEDWHRGSDLSDGKYNYDTFRRIIGDILRREFLKPNVATKNEE